MALPAHEVTDDRLFVGRILCDKWRLESVLGRGGMASVWAASHRNGRRVAVKVLDATLSNDFQLRERFLREGYVANQIAHPGVTEVIDDALTDDGLVLLVMELLEGQTLKERWVSLDRKMPPREAIDVAIAVLDILSAAHAADVVHRDVKPDNVFILEDGTVKLLDFGIARLREVSGFEHRTATGVMLGTPAYMPPEQALGHWDRVTPRSDVFAVAATLWSLITGRLVHDAQTAQELVIAAGTRHAKPLKEVMPSLPGPLCAVIDRALAFDEADRWPEASAMKDALIALTDAALQESDATASEDVGEGDAEVTTAEVTAAEVEEAEDAAEDAADSDGGHADASGDRADQDAPASASVSASMKLAPAEEQPPTSGTRRTATLIAAAAVLLGAGFGAAQLTGGADLATQPTVQDDSSRDRLEDTPAPSAEIPVPTAEVSATVTNTVVDAPVPSVAPSTETTSSAVARPRPPRPAASKAPEFNLRAAQGRVDHFANLARRNCAGMARQGEAVGASVSWRPDGSVAGVSLRGGNPGFRNCVDQHLRMAAIARFSGPSGSAHASVAGGGAEALP